MSKSFLSVIILYTFNFFFILHFICKSIFTLQSSKDALIFSIGNNIFEDAKPKQIELYTKNVSDFCFTAIFLALVQNFIQSQSE